MNQLTGSVTSQIQRWASRQRADYDACQPGTLFAEGVVLDVGQVYELQSAVAQLRCNRGERIIGYKVGCTSRKIRAQLGIDDKMMPPPARPLGKEQLSSKVREFPVNYGASVVGITTVETLAGGPPSTGLTYVLEGARSAMTFAVPLDENKTRDYLGKIDRAGHQKDYTRASIIADGIAAQLASFLRQFGHQSVAVMQNLVFRNDRPGDMDHRTPDSAHKYLAVRGGVGWFGFSGNVLTPDHGPNVILGSVVTSAELTPTDPLPPEDNYCDDCQACNASCPSGFFQNAKTDKVTVTIGGVDFTYTNYRSYGRCSYVCSGHTGLHPSGNWSTWSPARFPIPADDEDLAPIRKEAFEAWNQRPELPGGGMHVCHPDPEERKRRLKLLRQGGVIIQLEDGSMQSVSPEEATGHIAAMQPKRRALFEMSHPEDSDAKKYSGMGHHIHYSKETERRKGAGEEKETSDIGQE